MDRAHAGRELARHLVDVVDGNAVVLALPRGGVPVGYEIARALALPLDVWIARKLGAPQHEELGVGAVAEGGATYVDAQLVRALGIDDEALQAVAERERKELARRVLAYRGDRPRPDVRGRTVVLVDDGIATGGTARAAIASLRGAGAARIVVAVPVAAAQTVNDLARLADEVVAVVAPEDLWAIGRWYDDFTQTTDEEVLALLADAAAASRLRTSPHIPP